MKQLFLDDSSATSLAKEMKKVLRDDEWHRQFIAEALRRKADKSADEALRTLELALMSSQPHDRERAVIQTCEHLDKASHYTDIASALEDFNR